MNLIKRILWALTWRRRLCKYCANLESVSNFSPCYSCRRGSEYIEYEEEYERMGPDLSVEYRGYTAIQSGYNLHVMICKDGHMKMHSQCDSPMTEDGLREMIDNYLEISGKLAGIYDGEEG